MALEFVDKILLFTDGACSGNPGDGGYGTILVFPEGEIREYAGRAAATTNNRMELSAVIRGLREMPERTEEVWVLTDSTYVIRGITQWIWGWKKKSWKTADGKDVVNQDLWAELDRLVQLRKRFGKIDWKYVRGHSGIPGNERCDEIAVAFTQKKYVELYNGPLVKYPFAVHDLPDDLSLPPMREAGEKKVALSYLSYVNGQLKRHATWKECEAEVKGRPGAKFKKAMSTTDEIDIVKGWGLNPGALEEL